jgi:hypothetical protein
MPRGWPRENYEDGRVPSPPRELACSIRETLVLRTRMNRALTAAVAVPFVKESKKPTTTEKHNRMGDYCGLVTLRLEISGKRKRVLQNIH